MIELYIKFIDPEGEDRRVAVDRDKFAVGRHSENDLSIADGRLSREHLRIERFGDVFVVAELGSSNGTTLNAETLTDPVALKNGDKLSIGGLEIEVEIGSDDPNAEAAPSESESEPASNAAASNAAAASTGDGGLPTSFFVIAPLIGLVVLLIIGLILFSFSGEKPARENSNFVYSTGRDDDTPKNRKESNNEPDNSPSPGTNDNSQNASTTANTGDTNSLLLPATPNLSDTGKPALGSVAARSGRADDGAGTQSS